jgi:hypothetical protein
MVSKKHILYLCQYARANKFSVPAGFWDKSPAWLRRHYNGIGAEWMPPKVRNIVTAAFRHMEPETMVHDIDFIILPKSFWNFTKANLRLAFNAFKARHTLYGIALAVICQLFGWSAWKDGKESMAFYYYLKELKK